MGAEKTCACSLTDLLRKSDPAFVDLSLHLVRSELRVLVKEGLLCVAEAAGCPGACTEGFYSSAEGRSYLSSGFEQLAMLQLASARLGRPGSQA